MTTHYFLMVELPLALAEVCGDIDWNEAWHSIGIHLHLCLLEERATHTVTGGQFTTIRYTRLTTSKFRCVNDQDEGISLLAQSMHCLS